MFHVERSHKPGPRGGKSRGYCLAWHGPGHAPHGRSRRSGWYLHKPDAERACDVANDAWRRDLARPLCPALHKGDGSFVVQLNSPDGTTLWDGPRGETPDGREASRFNNARAAHAALARFFGNGPAFWESERASAAMARERSRGWRGQVVPDAELVKG